MVVGVVVLLKIGFYAIFEESLVCILNRFILYFCFKREIDICFTGS